MANKAHRVCRRHWVVAASLALLLFAAESPAADYIWLEGENPTHSNITDLKPSSVENKQYLSEGQWLSYFVKADEPETKVPAGGALFDYDFEIKAAGTYQVWDRIGLESIRTAFQWRVDEQAWNDITGKELTTDLMRGGFYCEISWLKLGQAELSAGKHTLHIRAIVTHHKDKEVEKFSGVNFTVDAFCLYKGEFHPHGKFKPDEEWRQELDKKAADQVFTLQAVKNPGEHATTPLSGNWEITRYDEGEIAGRTEPVQALPKPEECIWMGIAVPENKNKARPELSMCHRFVYRTRLNVPADAKGSAVCLHFPCNSLFTSVFVNGVKTGSTDIPHAVWDCDITQFIKAGEVNELCVAMKDTYYAFTDDTRGRFHVPYEHVGQGFMTQKGFDYPVAGRVENGILLEPSVTVSGPVYVADIFAIPSVKDKQLTLETTLRNPGTEEAKVSIVCEVAPLAGGPAEKTFAAVEGTVPAGKELTLKASEKWDNPKLWWPDDPNQYYATVKLSVNGKPADTSRIKFGFRQWEWEGADFKLNGFPWHGFADTTAGSIAEIKKRGQNMVRLWGGPEQVSEKQLDEMDAGGMPVRWTGIFDGEVCAYSMKHPELFQHYIDQTLAWVRANRNHPSIFIWSIENEITFINARNTGNLPVWEPWATKCWNAVHAIDPTRPGMVDGGRALRDKSLPVYGCHYEESDLREYPDDAYTLRHFLKDLDAWTPWPCDRTKPVLMGESFYVRGYPASWFAGLCGEKAFLGRLDAAEGASLLLKMLSEGYRWNGVTFHFWVGGSDASTHYNAWKEIALFSREWNWTFGSQATVKRTLKVFNDTHYADPIDALWSLQVKGQAVQEGKRTFNLAPGTAEEFEISFAVPAVTERTSAAFVLSCMRGGKEVYREEKPVAIIPVNAAAKPNIPAVELFVLDPNGAVKTRLKERGVAFTEVEKFENLPEKAKCVIVGKDALTAQQSTDPRLLALAAGGARVMVLDQAQPLQFMGIPADLDATKFAGRIAFAENLQNPCFAGLDQPDFFTWSKDHIVYRNAYKKASRGATSLVQCESELSCTALAMCPVNDGLLLLCQLVVGEKLSFDPVAQRLFDNMLNYCADYAPTRKQTAVVFASDRPEFKMLAGSGLQFDPASDVIGALSDGKHEIVVAQASPENLKALAENPDKLKAFTDRGGSLMLWGLDEKGLADFNRVVGVEHLIRPFEMEKVSLPAQRDPVLSGLTMRDIVMESGERQNAWTGDSFAANDIYTSVVDVDDVAPFCTVPPGTWWGYDDSKPGWDHWPRNMFNGFMHADSWKYCFTIVTDKSKTATKWAMTFPRELEFTSLDIVFTPIFKQVQKFNLYFDNDPAPVSFEVTGDWKEQKTYTLPAPRKAKVVTMELTEYEKNPLGSTIVGIDNMWLHVKRSPDFNQKVRPLLNVGGLVKYRMGAGGIVLNSLRVAEHETVPVNAQKKQNIVATLLRNMGATFSGGKLLIAGAGMAYTPIELGDKCNMFLTHDKGWFDARDLSMLSVGEQKFGGAGYLIRDFKTSPLPSCIMLSPAKNKAALPAEVKGIKIGKKADALLFLQTARYTAEWKPPNDKKADQTPPVVFKYVVHYADGSTADVPIVYNSGVGNWAQDNPAGLKEATLAWTAPFANGKGNAAVYQHQWNNPKPEAEISEVDMVLAEKNYALPVLLGITVGNAVR